MSLKEEFVSKIAAILTINSDDILEVEVAVERTSVSGVNGCVCCTEIIITPLLHVGIDGGHWRTIKIEELSGIDEPDLLSIIEWLSRQ